MLTAIREVQIPLLAAVLLGACAAKIWKALRVHADGSHSEQKQFLHVATSLLVDVCAPELNSSGAY